MRDLKIAVISNKFETCNKLLQELIQLKDIDLEICITFQTDSQEKLSIPDCFVDRCFIDYISTKESRDEDGTVRFSYLRWRSLQLGTLTRYTMILDDDITLLKYSEKILKKSIELCDKSDVFKGVSMASTVAAGLLGWFKIIINEVPVSCRGLLVPSELARDAFNEMREYSGSGEDIFLSLYMIDRGYYFYKTKGFATQHGKSQYCNDDTWPLKEYIKEKFDFIISKDYLIAMPRVKKEDNCETSKKEWFKRISSKWSTGKDEALKDCIIIRNKQLDIEVPEIHQMCNYKKKKSR